MKIFTLKISSAVGLYVLLILGVTIPLNAQTTPDGSMPQFLYPDFTLSKVRMKNGQYQSVMLNYNTVSEKMVYRKDEELYDMVNTDMMDTIYLRNGKFVPAGKVFYEVLLTAPAPLYVQYSGHLLPPGAPAGYGGTSQVSNTKMMTSVQLSQGYYNLKLPADFSVKVDPVFWIRRDSAMYSFMNERQFLKLFPDKAGDLKQFIKQNRIKFDNLTDMVALARHFNQVIR